MMDSTSTYRMAFEAAKRELAELIATREQTERKILVLRKSIETLSSLCESQGMDVDGSAEAAYLIGHSSLPDEIRALLRARYPHFARPNELMEELKKLGRDLSNYDNPQAVIQTILKRMISSDGVYEATDSFGKKAYRAAPISPDVDKIIQDSLGIGKAPAGPLPPQTAPKTLTPGPSGITKFRVRPATKGRLTGPGEGK
jgi:hypothetical protein